MVLKICFLSGNGDYRLCGTCKRHLQVISFWDISAYVTKFVVQLWKDFEHALLLSIDFLQLGYVETVMQQHPYQRFYFNVTMFYCCFIKFNHSDRQKYIPSLSACQSGTVSCIFQLLLQVLGCTEDCASNCCTMQCNGFIWRICNLWSDVNLGTVILTDWQWYCYVIFIHTIFQGQAWWRNIHCAFNKGLFLYHYYVVYD